MTYITDREANQFIKKLAKKDKLTKYPAVALIDSKAFNELCKQNNLSTMAQGMRGLYAFYASAKSLDFSETKECQNGIIVIFSDRITAKNMALHIIAHEYRHFWQDSTGFIDERTVDRVTVRTTFKGNKFLAYALGDTREADAFTYAMTRYPCSMNRGWKNLVKQALTKKHKPYFHAEAVNIWEAHLDHILV